MNGLRDRAPSMNHHTRQNATGFCGSPASRRGPGQEGMALRGVGSGRSARGDDVQPLRHGPPQWRRSAGLVHRRPHPDRRHPPEPPTRTPPMELEGCSAAEGRRRTRGLKQPHGQSPLGLRPLSDAYSRPASGPQATAPGTAANSAGRGS